MPLHGGLAALMGLFAAIALRMLVYGIIIRFDVRFAFIEVSEVRHCG